MSFLASRTRDARQGIGKAILRKEDPRLVTGAGCYTDDVTRPGQVYACMVRSPHAHAAIRGIDGTDALKARGVIAVLTGADAAGFRNAIRAGLDVLASLYAARTEVGMKFDEIREKEGLGAALKWRAAQFAE